MTLLEAFADKESGGPRGFAHCAACGAYANLDLTASVFREEPAAPR